MRSVLAVASAALLGVVSSGAGAQLSFASVSTSTGAPRISAESSPARPVVQIRRAITRSPVAIRVWSSDDAHVGLRAILNRTGELVGYRNSHVLYVSSTLAFVQGGAGTAWLSNTRWLWPSSFEGDAEPCRGGGGCAPPRSFTYALSDSLLRGVRDSLVIGFGPTPEIPEWSIVLRRPLIDRYLFTVDSVVAALRVR
ncbi:MAG TPA: hypothetical protein VEA99_13440 [Gemmatimonadaceae bacterium]|nr:hypothetical protein [Gemmatimonadaceae bacterium]